MGLPGIAKTILAKNKTGRCVQPKQFIRLCITNLRTDILINVTEQVRIEPQIYVQLIFFNRGVRAIQ